MQNLARSFCKPLANVLENTCRHESYTRRCSTRAILLSPTTTITTSASLSSPRPSSPSPPTTNKQSSTLPVSCCIMHITNTIDRLRSSKFSHPRRIAATAHQSIFYTPRLVATPLRAHQCHRLIRSHGNSCSIPALDIQRSTLALNIQHSTASTHP
ncbi:hypothetical protein BOTBODRAFT_30324 [Botryobasidium botryosum FD-172 SS1]|uniref:Uncharacterized protein n=1 Tax=Botryobasidium botryosum (strain FD-172 SS1) TaxID=930990 RepID=A0A067MYI5_BOTB1|nr:hypothetical protein BOTBODRAFT_30324 [Botryobasidium botryosum FD-172 SS1]